MTVPKLNGSEGKALIVYSLFAICRGITYFYQNIDSDPLPHAVTLLTAYISLDYFAAIWVITGIIGVVYSFIRDDAIGVAALAIPFSGWTIAYGLQFLYSCFRMGTFNSSEFMGFFIYLLLIASMVWLSGDRKEDT